MRDSRIPSRNDNLPVIDIVIVDYSTGPLLRECLKSIERELPKSAILGSVVVVDNASPSPASDHTDGIALPLRLIRNPKNMGFAAACNQGARECAGKYLLFLNPDARILSAALDLPVELLERPENEFLGIVGPQLLDEDGRILRTCSYHPRVSHFVNKAFGLDRLAPTRFSNGLMAGWDHRQSRSVDSVMGAAYFVRRSLYDMLGGFDERFFVYFEENDFSLRAQKIGFKSYFLAEARAHHVGCGASAQIRPERLFYSVQSRIRYAHKHFGRLRATLLLVVTLFIEPIGRFAYAAARLSSRDFRDTARGYSLFLRASWNASWSSTRS